MRDNELIGGLQVLFLSPRNTIAQNVSLMTQMRCSTLLHSAELTGLANLLKNEMMNTIVLNTHQLEALDELIAQYTEPYEYLKTYEQAKDDPIIVLHSSGSTGDPKPITNTHAFFAAADRELPLVKGRELGGIALMNYDGGGGYYSPFPGFHLAGITALAFFPVMMK